MTETFIFPLSLKIIAKEVESMEQKHSDIYRVIGQTIKKYRKLRNLTQEQLADKACISISYLTKIEAPNCDQPFSLEVILDISEVLDVSIHNLLEDIE